VVPPIHNCVIQVQVVDEMGGACRGHEPAPEKTSGSGCEPSAATRMKGGKTLVVIVLAR